MKVNFIFIALTFIVMVIIVILSDTFTTAALIVSLLANFLIINAHFHKISKGVTAGPANADMAKPHGGTVGAAASGPAQSHVDAAGALDDQYHEAYGPFFEQWDAYKNSYIDCYDDPRPVVVGSCSEQSYGIDAMNVSMAQHRARDKKCLDGWASKNADYFAYHYANELNEAEQKPWWSRTEY